MASVNGGIDRALLAPIPGPLATKNVIAPPIASRQKSASQGTKVAAPHFKTPPLPAASILVQPPPREGTLPWPTEVAERKSSWLRSCVRRSGPSLVSLIAHCLVILLLGLFTFAAHESSGAFLVGAMTDEPSALNDAFLAPPEEPPSNDPNSIEKPSGKGDKAIADIEMPVTKHSGLGGVGDGLPSIFGAGGVAGLGGGGGGSGNGFQEIEGSKSARFFGLDAKGTRFVFVIDSSTSMWGPRWIDVRKELIRSIRKLQSDQYFYVVCFDTRATQMFGDGAGQTEFSAANEENFHKLEFWLSEHTLGPGTKATDALNQALKLKPDAIFLLTDGEFQDNVLQMLRTQNRNKAKRRKTPVNTIGFHSPLGAPVLGQIASENNGRFQYVAPPPDMPFVRPMRFGMGQRVFPPQTMVEVLRQTN